MKCLRAPRIGIPGFARMALGVAVSGILAAACTPDDRPVVSAQAADVSGSVARAPEMGIGRSGAGNYLAGRFANNNRDFGVASELLSNALAANPGNRQLLRRTFLAMLSEGRVDAATEFARKIADSSQAAPIARLTLVVEAVKANRLADAEAILQDFPDRGFSGFMKPLLLTWVLAGQQRHDDALAALKPLEKAAGLRVLYELHAALLSDLTGRTDAAADHYRKASDAARRSTLRVVEGYGRHLERTGKVAEARTLYESYLEENPDSVVLIPALERLSRGRPATLLVANAAHGVAEALFNIASTMTQENSAQLALIYGRLAVHLRSNFDLAQMLVGGILESMDRPADAIAAYNGVSPDSPLHWSSRLRVAANLEAMGRDEEAISRLRDMAQENNKRPDALVSLGDILRAKKRYEESVDAYDRAIGMIGDIDKRHWTLLYSRGISLERSKQWSRAEKDFERALQLNPEQPYVLNYLGYSWVDQGINLQRARRMIERAVELRPNDGYIVDSLGWVLYRLKDFGPAVVQLERAVELRPQDPTINDHLGDAYWKVGRYNEARFQWRRALSLGPEPDAVSVIQRKIIDGLADSKRRDSDS